MAAPRRCDAGHELAPSSNTRPRPCSVCRREAIAAQVALADPTLDPRAIEDAISATVTSPAVLRDLTAALAAGPAALAAGAPPVVGRLVTELIARGSRLAAAACAICGRTGQRLVRSGTGEDPRGVCPRCRSWERTEPCARCARVERVTGRDAEGAALCFRCAPRPKRRCGICGELRVICQRARNGSPDICVNCYELPTATCTRCGRERPCNFVSTGRPVCAGCSPRRFLPCAHCGQDRPPCVRWPEGPVCEPCYRRALGRRGPCAACGGDRRLVHPPGPTARLCCDCGGVAQLAVCRDCGREDRLHDHGWCGRCALAARSQALLADASGTVPAHLARLHASITANPQPYSALNWLRSGAAAAILSEVASGTLPLTHEALDAHPRRRAADYLRQMLVANGALDDRAEEVVRMERWVAETLESVASEQDRRLLRAYATWGVLRPLRRRAAIGGVVRTRHAKVRILTAVGLLAWLRDRKVAFESVGQPDIDAWLVEAAPASYDVRHFLAWAADRRIVGRLDIPVPVPRPGSALGDEARWRIVERLLHDETADLTDRVAGCLVLLYAQQLTRIVAITTERVSERDDGVHLQLGAEEVALPEPLGALVLRLIAAGRRYTGVGSPRDADGRSSWLLPGHLPGRPLSAARLGERLGKLGIDARAGRRSALMHLASRLPAAVLAEVLDLSPGTAVDWVRAAGGEWGTYAGELLRTRDREGC
jgi:hypothetical protein